MHMQLLCVHWGCEIVSLGKGGMPYEVQKGLRRCCCTEQDHLDDKDVQRLVRKSEWQLRNLEKTFTSEVTGRHIVDIRDLFHYSEIPFRYRNCPRSSMVCCGSCTKFCNSRCPQDVLNRAHIMCASIIYAQEGEARRRAYEAADTPIKFLYDELTSDLPRYFAIAAAVSNIISPTQNKALEKHIAEVYNDEDSPYRLDYAPVIEYEQFKDRYRKKVDLETGEVKVLHWPRSGMCPFCLPNGLSERRRKR